MRKSIVRALVLLLGFGIWDSGYAQPPDADFAQNGATMRSSVAGMADRLAENYFEYLLKVNASLDERKIVKPAHRTAVIVPAANALGDSLIAEFDLFGADLLGPWSAKAPPLALFVEMTIANERERLVEFLRADPAIVLAAADRMARAGVEGSFGQFVSSVALATDDADSGAGLSARLRRAKIVGDHEVARVVSHRVRIEAAKVARPMAGAYIAFILKSEKAMRDEGIFDSGVRRSILAPEMKKVAEGMLADFDDYAATVKKSFTAGGDTIGAAAAKAVDAERARLAGFLATDHDILKAAIEEALNEGEAADGSLIMVRLEMEQLIRAEEEGR